MANKKKFPATCMGCPYRPQCVTIIPKSEIKNHLNACRINNKAKHVISMKKLKLSTFEISEIIEGARERATGLDIATLN